MNLLRRSVAAVILVGLAQACASGGDAGEPSSESVGSAQQAITTACSFDTLGLPCDPDGPAGPRLECEGFCTIQVSGYVTCSPVTVVNQNNGVVCGTSTGVGDAACKRYCSGKTCLSENAPAGAACRPTNGSNACEGQCNGSGVCAPIATPCDFGRRDQLCKQDTCNLANATQCLTKNLLRNTICSDADACSIGKCSATGACVPGSVKGCNDGNDCTDDSCDPNSGGCIGVNDDTNTCSDGNACTVGEHCGGGTCIPGTVPVDCNDGNACTADSCDPNTGCAHIPKSCSDDNACTADSCDAQTGSCSNVLINCDDANPCTVDACDAATGCTHVAKNCDDLNACTADSCAAGTCEHVAVSCDDGDACTIDSCEAATGCAHTAISGCGVVGDGGAGAPGTPGGEGPGSESGGTAGTGKGGNAGSTSRAGTSQGGSSTGATSSAGGEAAGEGGSMTPNGGSNESSGCGCRVASGPRGGTLPLTLLSLVGLVAWRRRRKAA